MGSPYLLEPEHCLMNTEVVLTTGVMGSGKTAALLNLADQLTAAGEEFIVIKPMTDTRTTTVWSRDGREAECYVVSDKDELANILRDCGVQWVLVDEAQFFNADFIEAFCILADCYEIKHLCFYSLKTDYLDNLFEGWKKITDYANKMFELQMRCEECGKQNAVHNHRVSGGDELFEIGTDNYKALCHHCKEAKTGGK